MIVAFMIWSFCAALFAGIGIYAAKAEKPVGFFTFTDPPQVNNTKRYNKAMSRLWLVSAVLFELLGIPFLFATQNSPVFIVSVLGTVFLMLGMMLAYFRIADRYKTK